MAKNLILVSLDTVRADVAYSGRFETLEDIRRQGISFLNAVSSSPLTPVSHATVFTGLQPYHHGIRHLFKEKLYKSKETLAQRLKKAGYKTGAVVSCPGMNRWYGFSRGFDFYDDEIPKLPDGSDPLETVDVQKRGTALKRGELVYKKGSEWLDENKHSPFFLFLHFFDAHWPYEAPQKYGGANIYEHEVAYSAHYLRQILEKIKNDGLWENTTLVVFSDHGEDLAGMYPNDKAGEALGHPEECGHGCLLYEQTQRVILIIKDASIPKNVNIRQQVRLVDVVPTVLNLLELKYNPNRYDGESLLPIIREQKQLNLVSYSETFFPEEQRVTKNKFGKVGNKIALRFDSKYKAIFHLGSNKLEVYNLENDPHETKNLII